MRKLKIQDRALDGLRRCGASLLQTVRRGADSGAVHQLDQLALGHRGMGGDPRPGRLVAVLGRPLRRAANTPARAVRRTPLSTLGRPA